ncbi:hypothetical protein LCGC14_0641550 [marine sediment metagenome]|uniref:Uncharacterized protein n=1 Tax=marine sediment metagenome TaxID=412755 RepID=A0A0F9QZ20_9ZZZZ|nr:hypothetical protein [archaeon]
MEIKFNKKEVALVKRQASGAMTAAQSLKIKTKEDLKKGVELLTKIKTALKLLKEKKEKTTKPANAILKEAREFYRPLEESCKEAERIVKAKMIDFDNKEEAKAKIKEAKISKQVEDGDLSFKKAADKLEKIIPEKTVKTKGGASIQYRTRKTIEITDETKIPRNYLKLDMVKIRTDALAGKVIPGVKVVERKEVAGSTY